MQWESGKVQRLVAQAQELLAEPSVSVHAKLGFFSRLALIPTALRARNNPDGRSLQQQLRSEEHTSELQSLMRISYAVFCLKKKNKTRAIIRYITVKIQTVVQDT